MTPEEMEAWRADLKAQIAERSDSPRREPHDHCHFTYRHGNYISPWFWPTRTDAEHASRSLVPDPRVPEAPEVYQVHGAHCACTPVKEGVPA